VVVSEVELILSGRLLLFSFSLDLDRLRGGPLVAATDSAMRNTKASRRKEWGEGDGYSSHYIWVDYMAYQ